VKIAILGGSGSLGNELTRQLLQNAEVEQIRIFSRNENKQAIMQREFNDPRMRYLIGDIRDYTRLKRALRGIDQVFHVAALKRVEKTHDVDEIEKTNVKGTENACNAAEECGVKKFIFTSSDKAAYPANVYGASKMFGEQKVLQMNAHSTTRYACTRYGNVLGSNGSILQVWPEQAKTGTIKITDARMTRFWITIKDAASFVIRCMNGMSGGEIFIPKMKTYGVERLARLIYPEASIEYIGMRDNGEKLHETMVIPEERERTKDYGDKYIIGGNHFGGIELEKDFEYSSDIVPSYTDEEMRGMI